MVMNHPILVVTPKTGLNRNLLCLALDDPEKEIHYVEPNVIDQKMIRDSSCIIVDDAAVPTAEELVEIMGPVGEEKPLVYLLAKPLSEAWRENLKSWNILLKPFTPEQLRNILENAI